MAEGFEVTCPTDLIERARAFAPLRTAVVNAVNDVVMQSVRDAIEAGVIEPVLIGAPREIEEAAERVGLDIAPFEIIAAEGEDAAAATGAQAASAGRAEAVMKGHLHTDIFMRALLQRDAGLRIGKPFTHVFHMTAPGHHKPLLITDAALNPAPDVALKQAITTNAVDLSCALGVERPRVSLLSASEVVNERVPSSVEAAAVVEWAKRELPQAIVEGPLAFDLAMSPASVALKGIESEVGGESDILVVPEIVAGNALFKMMVQFIGACAGGVVLGAKVPILLTSRADPPAARLASAAVASIARQA